MNTIYLGSDTTFVTKADFTINGRAKDQVKWAYISTAGKDVSNNDYLVRTKQQLKQLGWDFEEMDISGKTEEQVYNMLKNKEAIFMQGGNTFYLLKQALACNFAKVLEKLLSENKVYVGSSAGSYIMCPNIEMANWKDTNIFNRHDLTDLTALNLVPFQVFCHFNRYSDDEKKEIQEEASQSKYKVYFLDDSEGLLAEDNKITLIKI